MDSGQAWTLFGSRKNSKPRVREMLGVGGADSPASSRSLRERSENGVRAFCWRFSAGRLIDHDLIDKILPNFAFYRLIFDV